MTQSSRFNRQTAKKPAIWFGIFLCCLLVILIAGEIGLRIYFTRFGDERQRISYIYSGRDVDRARALFIPLPFVTYGLNPNYPGHNSQGYRGDEITIPKPQDTFRIVAIGSSVTYGTFLPSEDAYPSQLEKILRDEDGYQHIEVINAGVGGYTSWEYLAELRFRILDLQPDLIIIYEATNDVTLRLIDPKYYTGMNLTRVWNDNAQLELPTSTLYRWIATRFNWMEDPNQMALKEHLSVPDYIQTCFTDGPYCDELKMTKRELFQTNKPIYYERNMRDLVELARANGVAVVFSSWAYFPDSLTSNPNQYMIQPERQEAVAEHNAILKNLGDELNVPFYDLEKEMPYNADFWIDGRHMTAMGAREQAEEYASFLVNNQLIGNK